MKVIALSPSARCDGGSTAGEASGRSRETETSSIELCDALDMKYEDNTLGGCSREPTPPQPTKADAKCSVVGLYEDFFL